MRTTGAPNSTTLRTDGAGSAPPAVIAAAALIVETCGTLAAQAARRGDLEAARYVLEQALRALAAARKGGPGDDDASGRRGPAGPMSLR